MSFHLLNEIIKEKIRKRGIKSPTEIQKLSIPVILKRKNTLIIAPTGTGKTEAAILPIFDLFLRQKREGISILYITPLRALNRDLLGRIMWWGKELGITIDVRHGDTSSYRRRKQALTPPHMLITTPETLQAILVGKIIRKHLKNVRWVIIDEIHELAEDKRGAQLSLALERLREITTKDFQRIGISATVGSPEKIAKFIGNGVQIVKAFSPKDIEISVEKPKPIREDRDIAQIINSTIDASSRVRRIHELLSKHKASLIFVNTREIAEILTSRLKIIGDNVGIHHSSLSQEVRVSTEKEFKEGKIKALVCTSSLELGLDIGRVDLVVQYGSPRQVTRLVQRVGRSGHGLHRKSRGVIITATYDDILESIVIAERAIRGELEAIEFEEKPYDVLAHQIVGIALDFGRINKEKAFKIIKRSFVYRNLTLKEFEETLQFLENLRLIWLEESSFGKTRKSIRYYYENLSTIPEEHKFLVRDMITQQKIGNLDESFVASWLEVGSTFIFKGSPWKVVGINENEGEIIVEPSKEYKGAIPSWIGEEIPVPYEVALEVGKIRRKGKINFQCDLYTKKRALYRIKKHEKDFPIPSDKTILIEKLSDTIVIHACFGSKVNQTLGRILSFMLAAKTGRSIAIQVDPYRIILHTTYKEPERLFDIDKEFVEPLLESELKRTSLFRWKFVNVAKRFGVIAKDSTPPASTVKRIIKIYENTIVYKETLKEVFNTNLDIKRTKEILNKIKKGEISIKISKTDRPSPLARVGFESYKEIIPPERAEREILVSLKRRIEDEKLELFCLYCTEWSAKLKVKYIDDDLKCQKCGARMLAIIKRDGNLKKLYRKFKRGEKLKKEELKEITAMQTSANLFLSYGKDAAIALAARGIGPKVAKRVLMESKTEEDLYRNILKAEREYARTRKFWD